MKPSTTDYLSITAALVAILLCGYGIGFLVGERTTRARLAPPAVVQTQPDWSAITAARLTRELELNPTQQAAVEREIQISATVIAAARQHAIREYRVALIDLHQRLLPHLDPNQRKQIEVSCQQLKATLDKDKEKDE